MKERKCSVKGCNNKAQKLSKCWNHFEQSRKKSMEKWKAKQGYDQPIKRSQLKPGRTKTSLNRNKKMVEVFFELAEERELVCEECKLQAEAREMVCEEMRLQDLQPAHIRSRGSAPQDATDKDDIIWLCHEHHSQLDDKSKVNMLIYPKVKAILVKMKNKEAVKNGREI